MASLKRLPNGLRTILTPKTASSLVAVKIFIKVGSQDDGIHGITHFLEHLLFQGRTGRSVHYEVERLGGIVNANTTRDYMSIYFVVANDQWPNILALVLDSILSFDCNEESLARERKTIRSEILAYQNSDSALWDLFSLSYWKHHPIRYPIRGGIESINSITVQDVKDHHKKFFTLDNIVVSCAGAVNRDEFDAFFSVYFRNAPPFPVSTREKKSPYIEKFEPGAVKVQRKIRQAHSFFAYQTEGYQSLNRFYLKAVANYLANGGFSRLYRILREEKGVVYSVQALQLNYEHSGIFLIHLKSNLEDFAVIDEVIESEIKLIQERGVASQELEFLKKQYAGQLARNFETTLSICSVYGIEEVLSGNIVTLEESIAAFNALDSSRFKDVSTRFLTDSRKIIVGNQEHS